MPSPARPPWSRPSAAGKRAAEAIDRYLSAAFPSRRLPPVPVRHAADAVAWRSRPSTKMTLTAPGDAAAQHRTPPHHLPAGGARLHRKRRPGRKPAAACVATSACAAASASTVCRGQDGGRRPGSSATSTSTSPRPPISARTEERCILCGACAATCPNQAIRIIDQNGERLLSYCGTILNRQKIERCRGCGVVLGPRRYLEFLKKRVQAVSPVITDQSLCPACSRRQTAHAHADNTPV